MMSASVAFAIVFSVFALSAKTLPPHVVVVGAGWSGWGAVKTCLSNGCRVTLLDSLSDPSGTLPYLTPTGKPFEAGTRGFWRDYPNINELIKELKLKDSDIFTAYTNSSFYSPFGLEATAPVFSASKLPILPSPLGQIFATLKLFERLPLLDRASMFGLLYAMADFTRDEETFEMYDKMTAYELFQKFCLTKRLVDDFIRPTLLVGLFKPPEELSAAVAMELLYFYALAHQTSFDVRWIKGRSIAETIVAPMAKMLQEKHGDNLRIIGDARVSSVSVSSPKSDDIEDTMQTIGTKCRVDGVTYVRRTGESVVISDVDACVLSLGAKGLRSVLAGSPALAASSPELSLASTIGSIDVIACRIWLDRCVPTRSPANVFSRFEELRGAGGTFFMLDQLQGTDEKGRRMLWGLKDEGSADTDNIGSAIACDFYNSGALMTLSDENIIELLAGSMYHDTNSGSGFVKKQRLGLLEKAVPAFTGAKVVDFHVQRYLGAVNHFAPNSYRLRPPVQLADVENCVVAGDWVRMGDKEHGAKGLCQERAFVSGIEAGNALARSGVLTRVASSPGDIVGTAVVGAMETPKYDKQADVIPVRDDELQFLLAREANRNLKKLLSIPRNFFAHFP